jgi:hypothetical protein
MQRQFFRKAFPRRPCVIHLELDDSKQMDSLSINTVLSAGVAAAGAVTGGAHLPIAIGVAVGLELLSKPQESVVQGIVNKVLKFYDWHPNLTLFTTKTRARRRKGSESFGTNKIQDRKQALGSSSRYVFAISRKLYRGPCTKAGFFCIHSVFTP